MLNRYAKVLDLMDRSQRDFESGMPSPKLTLKQGRTVYRFEEPDIYLAVIQKLARVQSAVRAAISLWQNGYYQEQNILHRVIDETNEDIMFLVLGVDQEMTDLHERFLSAFWQEEFDDYNRPMETINNRPMIPRQKIRAFIANNDGTNNPSKNIAAARTLNKTYSGYVHGASPQIMEMYCGIRGEFCTKGMKGSSVTESSLNDLWNYVYRSLLSYMLTAKILGAKKHLDLLTKVKAEFEQYEGKN